jgi:hypothetical protein
MSSVLTGSGDPFAAMISALTGRAQTPSRGMTAQEIVKRAPGKMARLRMKAATISKALKPGSKGETDRRDLARDTLNDPDKGKGMGNHKGMWGSKETGSFNKEMGNKEKDNKEKGNKEKDSKETGNKEMGNTGATDSKDLPTGPQVIVRAPIVRVPIGSLAADHREKDRRATGRKAIDRKATDRKAIDPAEIINGVKVKPFQAKGRCIGAKGSNPARLQGNGTMDIARMLSKAVIAVMHPVRRQGRTAGSAKEDTGVPKGVFNVVTGVGGVDFSAGMARPQEEMAVVLLKETGATNPPVQALPKKTIRRPSRLKTSASKRTKKANTCARKNPKIKIAI